METNEIAEKAGLESFLVKDIQEVSKDKDKLKLFLEGMARDNDSLNRALITGGLCVHFSHEGNLNYARSCLEDAIIGISNAGGITIHDTNENGFYSRICPHLEKNSERDLVGVRDDAYFNHEKGAMEIRFNREDYVSAEVTIHPQGNIYIIKSVNGNDAILLRDSHFWQGLAQENDLKLETIAPQYTGKSPVTPWYKAADKESGATLTMGWRYRVGSIGIDFKNPITTGELNEVFGDVNTTKYTNGEWSAKNDSKDIVNSFTVHANSREDAKMYAAQLLKLARQ